LLSAAGSANWGGGLGGGGVHVEWRHSFVCVGGG
jgi:hypothetical protein